MELTIVSGLILLIISSAISISFIIRKRIKHGFLESTALSPISQYDLPKVFQENLNSAKNEILKSTTYFDYQKWPEIVDRLSSEGWVEENKIKLSTTQVRFFKRGSESMGIIDTKEGKVGIRK